jgi:cysteine desulfurase
MIRLDLAGHAVSTGSACSSGAVHVSRTMAAMGIDAEEALSSLRVSFGKGNTEAEVDGLLAALEEAVTALREARTATA